MPEALENGHCSQDKIDAIDFALYGLNSDMFQRNNEFEINHETFSYVQKKENLSIGELPKISPPITELRDGINMEQFDELCAIFPNFEKEAKLLGIDTHYFADDKLREKSKKRKKLFRLTELAGYKIPVGLLTFTVFTSGISVSLGTMSTSTPSLIWGVISIFGASAFLLNIPAYFLLERASKPHIEEVRNTGYVSALPSFVKKLLTKQPELATARITDFPNLHAELSEEAGMSVETDRNPGIADAVEQLENTLASQDLDTHSDIAIEHESVMQLRDIFTSRKNSI